MWGILPFGSSIVAIFLVLIPDRRRIVEEVRPPAKPTAGAERDLVVGRFIS